MTYFIPPDYIFDHCYYVDVAFQRFHPHSEAVAGIGKISRESKQPSAVVRSACGSKSTSNTFDIPVVGINITRPITRQRYTAAHELCHHIKDSKSSYVCNIAAADSVEKYAEAFTEELLMPYSEMKRQISLYEQFGHLFGGDDIVIHRLAALYHRCFSAGGYRADTGCRGFSFFLIDAFARENCYKLG